MIADMESNKKLSPIFTEFLLRGRKLNISLVFISQSYFKVFKSMILNATHYFTMKIPTKENCNKQYQLICLTLILKKLTLNIKILFSERYNFIIRQSITIQEELIIKISITEKIKPINNKIKQNKAQQNSDRQVAKIFSISSVKISKYELFREKDVLQEKNLLEIDAALQGFENSPLDKLVLQKNSIKNLVIFLSLMKKKDQQQLIRKTQ